MTFERLLFSLFAATSWLSAIGVVALRDPVKGALSLVACFFSLACLYLLQSAELIAVLEVLVYAGAIMVLFVFVIMLVDQRESPIVPQGLLRRVIGPIKVIAAAILTINLVVVIYRHPFAGNARIDESFGSPAAIGKKFFEDFIFQFELTSVLLLVAIVGAVIISRAAKGADGS